MSILWDKLSEYYLSGTIAAVDCTDCKEYNFTNSEQNPQTHWNAEILQGFQMVQGR